MDRRDFLKNAGVVVAGLGAALGIVKARGKHETAIAAVVNSEEAQRERRLANTVDGTVDDLEFNEDDLIKAMSGDDMDMSNAWGNMPIPRQDDHQADWLRYAMMHKNHYSKSAG